MIHFPMTTPMNPHKVAENHTQAPPQGTTLTSPAAIPVIVPNHRPSAPQLSAPWSTGLCDCFDDVANCLVTCFCPCITFGRIAEIIDGGETPCGVSGALYAMICCLMGCHWVYSCFYRSKMRGIFFLEESPCQDCVVHLCCDACALCQEYRELKNRGFNLELGWKGNLGRQSATTPPALEGAMNRANS